MRRKVYYNPYERTDLQALRQALEISGKNYKVIRQEVNKFNDKGRPDSIEKVDYIYASITPKGDLTVNRKGQGSWTAESFEVSYLYPDYLRVENLIEHPIYGQLKIKSINDMRQYGLSTAVAVRVGSIRTIYDKGERY